MGSRIELAASDGHKFSAWKAAPKGKPKAGIVVVQEVFGVNAHIRDVADRFAKEGYLAVAPAVFDRAEKGVELGYGDEDIKKGRGLRDALGWDGPLRDIAAAAKEAGKAGKVGIVGFCWGGSLTWVAACRLDVAAAVPYYGAQIIEFNAEKPRCPVLLHFGAEDNLIPPATVDKIRNAHPNVETHVWPGPHGFHCDHRAAYREESAKQAMQRTLAFLADHLI